MTTEIVTVQTSAIQPIISMVTNAVTSNHTKRAYERALTDFMTWHQATGQTDLDKSTVQTYIEYLRTNGIYASSINQRLTAIKKLAREAADTVLAKDKEGKPITLLPDFVAQAIGRVKGVRTEGKRLGNWLSKSQAQKLLDAPDTETVKGLRDKAIMAVLLGCGLRREECAGLTFEHIQQREGRWVIVDLVGKRNKMRSVPMPSWAKSSVDAWAKALGMNAGYIFRPIRRGGHVQGGFMTAQAIFDVVCEYATKTGITVKPHDLRRSFAKLAHKGNAPIEQIQLSLGHASVQTTERYLGVKQDLHSAPCDVLGLE